MALRIKSNNALVCKRSAPTVISLHTSCLRPPTLVPRFQHASKPSCLDSRQITRRIHTLIPKAASSPSQENNHEGHAFLHDFCMTIPYAAMTLVAAGILAYLGAKALAIPMAVCSLVVGVSSIMSLKSWRTEQSTTITTLLSGGTAAYVAWSCWVGYQSGLVPWLNGIMLVASATLSLFCFYNIAAGGNPPPKKK